MYISIWQPSVVISWQDCWGLLDQKICDFRIKYPGWVSIFSLFSAFFAFFRLFRFKCFALLRFSDFCFEVKQSEAEFKPFFRFFHFFFAFFHLIFVSLQFFRLFFAYFTFIFASDFWCFTSKWIMWNQAFFSLRSETKFSLQFQISGIYNGGR